MLVHEDFREGVESVEDKVYVLALERSGVNLKRGAVLPIGKADPLQARFVVAIKRVGNELRGLKVRLHHAWHLCGVPIFHLRMIGCIQCAEFPPGINLL